MKCVGKPKKWESLSKEQKVGKILWRWLCSKKQSVNKKRKAEDINAPNKTNDEEKKANEAKKTKPNNSSDEVVQQS